ncbi:zinc-dependent hydrolase, peptidase M20 family [Malaciobacter marinus]|uniref:Zinc-dependent hydrolase, peptidase M20 family n=1 Tax=Malaciobacter marinus TaxID=505249 RepID=A0A347TNR2_9BACT|nr:M20 family metallo-hydrolase [Malaciobacter marinus]AXX88240.1 zinc-dependent hydrolase, peptidase M20 family [Malaciobacter marinus]PHO15165.1 Zn-dependent hydrolase [Malaciobacter marinus]
MLINEQRLKSELAEISEFGKLDGGGITRLAFSIEEKNAREYLKKLMLEIDLKIEEDAIGNIYATLTGSENLEPVISGSHLDSVPLGGCYDGTLGVMCALEAIRTIKENDCKHLRPIQLIVFSCEESSRFNMATLGSKVITGKLNLDDLKRLKDKTGISVYDAAKDFGCSVDELNKAVLEENTMHSYIELHIEQGPVLENHQIPVGIVTGIASPIRYELVIKGRADHSGATPMSMRKDALVTASKIIIGVQDIAQNKGSDTVVATIGYANAVPGVLNVIPGEVKLGIDIRDIDKDSLFEVDKLVNELIKDVITEDGLTYELTQLCKDTPTKLDDKIVQLLENEANKLSIKSLRMPSGAGHDAMHMPKVSKYTGMIFVPCKEGISHNVKEEINLEDIYQATNVLANSLLSLANEK